MSVFSFFSFIFSFFFISLLEHSAFRFCFGCSVWEMGIQVFLSPEILLPDPENLWRPDQRLTLSLSLLDSCLYVIMLSCCFIKVKFMFSASSVSKMRQMNAFGLFVYPNEMARFS